MHRKLTNLVEIGDQNAQTRELQVEGEGEEQEVAQQAHAPADQLGPVRHVPCHSAFFYEPFFSNRFFSSKISFLYENSCFINYSVHPLCAEIIRHIL